MFFSVDILAQATWLKARSLESLAATCCTLARKSIVTMAGWWMLLPAMLLQSSVGQELSKEQVEQAVHRALTGLKTHKSHLATARRLTGSKEMPDFSKMCKSACWTSITTGLVAMYKKLEADPVCAAQMTSDTECKSNSTRRLEEDKSCMFTDTCTSLKTFCDDPSKIPSYGYDNCTTPIVEWICDSICGTACTADHVEEKKLFCSGDDGSSDDSGDDSDDSCESGMDGDAMADAFNLMCVVDPDGEYCLDQYFAWEKKGAFKSESASEEFPDPCAIDCSTPTGKAIKDMGCCMAISLDFMKGAEYKAAAAAVYTCGGKQGLTMCDTSSQAIPAEVLIGGKGLATCPTTAAESAATQKSLAVELKTKKKDIKLVVCTVTDSTCGGGGRRLAEVAKNTMTYTVKVKGSKDEIAAKKAAMETNMKTVETSSGGKTNVPDKGRAGSASKAGQSSLSILLAVLVVSAILK